MRKRPGQLAIGRRMKASAESAGLDRAAVAQRLEVKTTTVQRWWDGDRAPDPEMMDHYAGLVGMSVDWLETGHAEAGPPDLVTYVGGAEEAEREHRALSTEELAGLTGSVLEQLRTVYEELQARSAAERDRHCPHGKRNRLGPFKEESSFGGC